MGNTVQPRVAEKEVARAAGRLKTSWTDIALKVAGLVLIGGYCLTSIAALLWTVSMSLRTDPEIYLNPIGLPEKFRWEFYVYAWNQGQIGRYFFNSVYVTGVSLVGALAVSAGAGYVLGRIQFGLSRLVLFYFLAAMMVPGMFTLIPLYFLVKDLGLFNSHLGLIVLYITGQLPFNIFILTGFFKTLPSELEEAAMIDGAGPFEVFYRVMLPLASPGLITIAIFNFIGIWNDFFMALIFIRDAHLYTLARGAWYLLVGRNLEFAPRFATMVILMVPVLVVFGVLQERITQGLTVGALKG